MMDSFQTFFCRMCKCKSQDDVEHTGCHIDHSIKTYKQGDYIVYQNDDLNHLYMLSKGKVQTQIVSDSGLTIPMETITAPYPIASAYLFSDNNQFPVDVIALEDSEVLLIKKETIESQMSTCHDFLRGFLAFNANRTQDLSGRITFLAQKSIKAKLVYYIMQIHKGNDFKFEKSLTELSKYFSVERPSLSRAISEMVKEGIIEYSHGKGKILNYSSLQELLNG